MVIDTSALIALLFNEKDGVWAENQMKANADSLLMSTVNLAETLILVQDRQPKLFEAIKEEILSSSIRFVAPSVAQAERAAEARLRYPLNLGDCFAYALAIDTKSPVLTLDRDFKKTDAAVVSP